MMGALGLVLIVVLLWLLLSPIVAVLIARTVALRNAHERPMAPMAAPVAEERIR